MEEERIGALGQGDAMAVLLGGVLVSVRIARL